MSERYSSKILMTAFFAALVLTCSLFGDILKLNDGRTFQGTVTEDGDDYVVAMKLGNIRIPKSDVISRTAGNDVSASKDAVSPKSVGAVGITTTKPPATQPAKTSPSIPPLMIDLIRMRRLVPIESSLATNERAVKGAQRQVEIWTGKNDPMHYLQKYQGDVKADNIKIAELKKNLADERIAVDKLIADLAAKYPQGAVRCPTCQGTGHIVTGTTHVPGDVGGSGIGSANLVETAKCQICDGVGIVSKDDAYEKDVGAVTHDAILSRRRVLVWNWDQELNQLEGRPLPDGIGASRPGDEIFMQSILNLPKSQKITRLRSKIAELKALTDHQVAETIVDDQRSGIADNDDQLGASPKKGK